MATVPASVVTVTDAAAAKIRELIAAEEGDAALRIAVTGGGCSGFQYALGFDTDVQDDDVRYLDNGVPVVVDELSAEYLAGAHVDFTDGLSGKGFSIENPNATASCGCGQSFSC